VTNFDTYEWGLLALKAEFGLSRRLKDTPLADSESAEDPGSAEERVASGLYALVRASDGLDHAVRLPEYLTELREALELIGTRQHALGQQLVGAAHRRKALCGVELFLGDLNTVRAWTPSKTACPGCIAAC
jgi:hypothetical protein